MCVCVCLCAYVCVYVLRCVRARVSRTGALRVCVCVWGGVPVRVGVHVCIYMCVCVFVCVSVRVCMCVYMYVCTALCARAISRIADLWVCVCKRGGERTDV